MLEVAGAAHDRRRSRRRADDGVHRPVAAAAQSRQGHAGPAAVPGLRRQRPSGDSARRRSCSSPASSARTGRRSTLLDADYTFVNERLARHYGIPKVYGSRFRRVPVTDPNRRGLLGQGSILSMTSAANRTSPMLRGKYIISNLLNTPPLPPPADVPDLEESATEGPAVDGARAARAASRQPDVRGVPPQHRSGGLCARELRRRRSVA